MPQDLGFGMQTFFAYGTRGEFTIGEGASRTVAHYLLTKIRPGNDGSWENHLARKLRPWREVFSAGKVTFDEILQRDLDDSRVAMDLIPYLLGDGRNVSRFFPPILAIAVPLRDDKTGILDYYPSIHSGVKAPSLRFGNLFRVDPFDFGQEAGTAAPMSELTCNESKAGFVIADGQHRAMAVLALHRILTSTWDGDPYAGYYKHLNVTEAQVRAIELPVCIVYFPELTEDRPDLRERGVTLTRVCRDLFLTVNKQAISVSKSRQLLLDDEDVAARLMRRTLSKMKDRDENNHDLARVYSFAFGDADIDLNVSSRIEFSSASLLHRIHSATCFANTGSLDLLSEKDLTDQRSLKSPSRAPEILRGRKYGDWDAIGRASGRLYSEEQISEIVSLLADYSDAPIFALFDGLAPFVAHSQAMSAARGQLMDPLMKADPVQAKCHSLLFEGSGARGIFEQHARRVKDEIKEIKGAPPAYLKNQEADARAVQQALDGWYERVKQNAALRFLRVEPSPSDRDSVGKQARAAVDSLFSTVSTQAFQLGFCLGVHGAVQLVMSGQERVNYDQRVAVTALVARAWVCALNAYWTVPDEVRNGKVVQKQTVSADVRSNSNLRVFDPEHPGLRTLLALSVKELNESQYTFFRYATLELVHCAAPMRALLQELRGHSPELATAYTAALPQLASAIVSLRQDYLAKGQEATLRRPETKMQVASARAVASARDESPDSAQALFEENEREAVRKKFEQFLHEAVGNAILESVPLADSFVAVSHA